MTELKYRKNKSAEPDPFGNQPFEKKKNFVSFCTFYWKEVKSNRTRKIRKNHSHRKSMVKIYLKNTLGVSFDKQHVLCLGRFFFLLSNIQYCSLFMLRSSVVRITNYIKVGELTHLFMVCLHFNGGQWIHFHFIVAPLGILGINVQSKQDLSQQQLGSVVIHSLHTSYCTRHL